FSLGHRVIETAEIRFEENQRTRALDDLIGGYIRSSYPYRASPREPVIFYSGEPEKLVFISSYSLAMGGRGMAKISLFWEAGGSSAGAIKLEEEVPVRLQDRNEQMQNDRIYPDWLGSDREIGQKSSLVLHEGVRHFGIAYLDPQGEEERWEERWDAREKRRLPRAVRLTYRTATGDEVRRVFPIMMTVLGP
ncbi:MAG TPA: type II secretion system protein GspJ, partial [Candidatus Eisenbacteria bacterium]|nr:type II secretion system protein GspJ [Candidatus Eisenbacteria bacterium]